MVVIAYDGSPAAELAIREAGRLLAPRRALVVVVFKEGIGFELLETPTATLGLPPAMLDVSTALEVDRRMAEGAQRLAQQGAGVAREAGFEVEALAIGEDVDTPVADAILRVAREREARAIVIGRHGHGAVAELLGRTSRDVVRHAPCPVVVASARAPEEA